MSVALLSSEDPLEERNKLAKISESLYKISSF
jgi:hypothetical protein